MVAGYMLCKYLDQKNIDLGINGATYFDSGLKEARPGMPFGVRFGKAYPQTTLKAKMVA